MKKYIVLLIVTLAALQAQAQEEEVRPAHIGLIYPISSNGVNAAQYSNLFSLHLLSGVSKNELSLAIAGLSNIIRENATGVQIAGLYNHTGRSVSGVQIAGLGNFTKRKVEGAQISGFINITDSVNTQVAGFLNLAGPVEGVQIGGFMNKAADVNAQVGGFLNIARKVKGVQVSGFINVADSSDYPIGVINLVKNGDRALGLGYDESGIGLLTFRSGGRILYSLLGVGYNFSHAVSRDYYALEAGLGAHLLRSRYFRLNAEITSQIQGDFREDPYAKHALRLLPTLRIGNRLEIFGGPSLNFVYYDTDDYHEFDRKYFWQRQRRDDFRGFHLGYTVGLQMLL